MNAADVAGLLEVVASERPDLLRAMVAALEYSRAAGGFADLAKLWGAAPENLAAQLVEIAEKTLAGLYQLERTRRAWRHPREVVDGPPNVAALQSFAHGRRARVRNDRRAARLSLIARKLDRAAESERRRRSLDRFLTGPVKPVDPAWLKEFLKR